MGKSEVDGLSSTGHPLLLDSEGRRSGGASGTTGTEDGIGTGYAGHAPGGVETGGGAGETEEVRCRQQGWRQITAQRAEKEDSWS